MSARIVSVARLTYSERKLCEVLHTMFSRNIHFCLTTTRFRPGAQRRGRQPPAGRRQPAPFIISNNSVVPVARRRAGSRVVIARRQPRPTRCRHPREQSRASRRRPEPHTFDRIRSQPMPSPTSRSLSVSPHFDRSTQVASAHDPASTLDYCYVRPPHTCPRRRFL